MSNIELNDVTAILNYGLESQRCVADVNTVASDIIKHREYDEVLECFRELLSIAGNVDMQEVLKKERRLDELSAQFMKQRIELAKEGKVLQELRHTNEAYILRLDDEIKEAQEYLDGGMGKQKKNLDLMMLKGTLKKRIYELMTSRTVAESFTAQIKISEENCFSMSDKAWNATVTIIPLLRGRISMEGNRTVIERTQNIIRENMTELEGKLR